MNENTSYVAELARKLVQNSRLGDELSSEQCDLLGKIITVRRLTDGEFLLYEGHKDNTLYVLVRGKLEVLRSTGGGDAVILHILKEGDMAGELGFIDGLEHSAALRASGECEVFGIERKTFESLIPQDPDLVYKTMRAIVRTVHGILRRMNIQYVELTNYIIKQHGRY
jgi:CRP-like cAMP-binding protein